jgi:hypothetical protein
MRELQVVLKRLLRAPPGLEDDDDDNDSDHDYELTIGGD